MITISEGTLNFTFDDDWAVVKWDECEFRKRREHHGRAVDMLGLWEADGRSALFVLEVKDYPDHPKAVSISPEDLANICSEKVRDSLAQVLFSAVGVGRPAEREVDLLCRAFGSTDRELHFGLWIEDARSDGLDVIELQDELERAFRWLPARAVSTFSLSEDPWPPGLSVRRSR